MILREAGGAYVEASGFHTLADETRIDVVVAKHPQRKPEGPFVDEVTSAFNGLAEESLQR